MSLNRLQNLDHLMDSTGPRPFDVLADCTCSDVITGITSSHAVRLVPGARMCYILPTVDVWVRQVSSGSATATVPSGDTTDGTGQKIVFAGVPRPFSLVGLSAMSLIGASDGLVEIGYYS